MILEYEYTACIGFSVGAHNTPPHMHAHAYVV